MVSIPVYSENKVGVSHTPTTYYRGAANANSFGAAIGNAMENLSNASEYYLKSLGGMYRQVQRTNALELSNKIDHMEKEFLLDPENGYYAKLGKNAMRNPDDPNSGAAGVLKKIEDKIDEEVQRTGLTWGYGKQMADLVKTRKLDTIYRGATAHELKQTKEWGITTLDEAENNAINKAVNHRDEPEIIDLALGNGIATIREKAKLLGWDADTVRIKENEFKSTLKSNVLSAYIQDGSLKATEFYEKNKDSFLPQDQIKYLGAVKNNELKYKVRTNAENLIHLPADQAFAYINTIENVEEQALTRQMYFTRLHENDRIKSEAQKQAEQASWEKIRQTQDINDIDLINSSPETIKAQMSYVEQMKKYGRIATDYGVFMELQDMSTYDAERFSTINLENYAANLSEDEFKKFKERQRQIGTMEYTVIQDDNKKIDAVLEDIGLLGGKLFNKNAEKTAYNEIRSLVKAWEVRHGQQINDSQLEELVRSLGYKDPKTQTYTYKELEKGMADKVGFIRQVTNDIAYFEKVHKRQPSQEERHKIIYNRANDLVQDKNKQTIQNIDSALKTITPRQGETKELTYFCDSYLPQLSKELGVRLTVVEGGRYRKPNGKYTSYHSTGQAADISMSEHTLSDKFRIVQAQLDNPLVKAIGTSDPYILNRYKNQVRSANNPNGKIVNETKFDSQQGTNHRNHIHITLNTKSKQQNGSGISEGTIIVNKQTGQRLQLKGGKWQAI